MKPNVLGPGTGHPVGARRPDHGRRPVPPHQRHQHGVPRASPASPRSCCRRNPHARRRIRCASSSRTPPTTAPTAASSRLSGRSVRRRSRTTTPRGAGAQVDAYAAVKEAQNPAPTQVVRIALAPQRGPDAIRVDWSSQREVGLAQLRARPRRRRATAAPGAWTTIHDAVRSRALRAQIHAAAESPRLRLHRRRRLARSRPRRTGTACAGSMPDGLSHAEPPLSRAHHGQPGGRAGPVLVDARLLGRRPRGPLRHRGIDARTRRGSARRRAHQRPTRSSRAPASPSPGTLQHYFHVDLTADDLVEAFLPPSAANPWFLSVTEGGYVNTKGRVNDFSVTVFGGTGPTTYAAPNPVTDDGREDRDGVLDPARPGALDQSRARARPDRSRRAIGEGLTRTITLVGDRRRRADAHLLARPDCRRARRSTRARGSSRGRRLRRRRRLLGDVPVSRSARFRRPAADTEVVAITVTERKPGDNLPPLVDPLHRPAARSSASASASASPRAIPRVLRSRTRRPICFRAPR